MTFMKLPLEMQFLIAGPFAGGLLLLFFCWSKLVLLSRIRRGQQNPSDQKIGSEIAIEGTVTTVNKLTSPVFNTPVAAAYWDIRMSGKGSYSVCRGTVGDRFSIQNRIATYTILIKPDDILARANFLIKPKSSSNSPVINKLVTHNSDAVQSNFRDFLSEQKIDAGLLGVNMSLYFNEYAIEYGKTYTILGKLTADRTIASDSYDNMSIFELPIQKVISKLTMQAVAFSVSSSLLFIGSVFLYFHIISL